MADNVLDNGTMTKLDNPTFDTLRVYDIEQNEIIRIDSQGRIFWRSREVETDDDFRAAMLELRDHLIGRPPPSYQAGCRSKLAPNQWWHFCGETDFGSLPALCKQCGGEYERNR